MGPKSPYKDPTNTSYMLISQPSIMWVHRGIWENTKTLCCWFSVLFPKAFASSVLTWAEYGIVVELHRSYQGNKAFYIAATPLSALYLLSLYTYFKVIYAGAGSPLDYAELRKDQRDTDISSPYGTERARRSSNFDSDDEASPLEPAVRSRVPPQEYLVSHQYRNGEPAFRWCNTCEVWKPDRCHHCSTCRRCYLRMDHHCPWYASCIGHGNHKYFIQDLLYVTAFSGLVCVVSTRLLYVFFAEAQYENDQYLSLNLVFLFVVSLSFFIAVGCFAAFSVYMVLKNYTTIEFQDARWSYSGDRDAQYEYDAEGRKHKLAHLYDLGLVANWKAVMGNTWIQWLLPVSAHSNSSVYAANNGLNFEVQENVFQKYVYNAQLQEQLNSQLADYRDRVRGLK